MLYYYANTGHKIGLERLRRGAGLLKRLTNKGIKTQLLVNDFRAGLLAKELGVKEYVTIETVQDIDAIAQNGDSIIIDSPEDDRGRLVKYCSDFKNVWRFAQASDDVSIHGETLFRVGCKEGNCVEAMMVDDIYFEKTPKEERTLFFLGDADYDKTILNNEQFFKKFDMELLLGNYFFVKYEDDLAKLFSTLHEPEEYVYLIKNASCIVTASAQTALEAKASATKVIFLDISPDALYPVEMLRSYGIAVVEGFDSTALAHYLQHDSSINEKLVKQFNTLKIENKL